MTTDPGAIKKTIRKCREQLHTHKFSNLKEMDSFLKTTNYQKLSEDKIESLSDPKTIKEIEFIILTFPIKEISGPIWFYWKIRTSTEKNKHQLYTISSQKKTRREGTTSQLLYEASITLFKKTQRQCVRGKHRSVSLMNLDAKILNKILAN